MLAIEVGGMDGRLDVEIIHDECLNICSRAKYMKQYSKYIQLFYEISSEEKEKRDDCNAYYIIEDKYYDSVFTSTLDDIKKLNVKEKQMTIFDFIE